MKALSPTDEKYFYSKGRPSDVRLGDIFFRLTAKSLEEFHDQAGQMSGDATLVLSYVDEKKTEVEGIKFSSRKSPQRIKNNLFQLTPPFFVEEKLGFVDCGSLILEGSLEDYRQLNREVIATGIGTGHRWLTLGGSQLRLHAEIEGWLSALKAPKKRPLLVHFASGLAMTDSNELNPDSLHRHLTRLTDVDLLVVGSHPGHFSKEHFAAFTSEPHCQLVNLDELCNTNLSIFDILLQKTEDWLIPRRPTWISVDISVLGTAFSGSYPVSRPIGLAPMDLLKTLSVFYQRQDLHGLGIFNVDADHAPGIEFASEIAYRYLYSL